MGEKVNIKDYIELYQNGLKLDQIKPLTNQTYKIFKNSGVDIRIVHRSKVYENPKAFSKIAHFIKDNEYFYMVPVTTINETIVGFIIRGVLRSDYGTIIRDFDDPTKRIPVMFGFDKSFKELENQEQCQPIIICEGSKDCLMLKQFYPYVLANNTNSMGMNAQVLINISNKFVLAYDSDSAGQEGIERDKKLLRSLGAQVASIELSKKFKDCADYLGHPEDIKKLKDELNYRIKRVLSF